MLNQAETLPPLASPTTGGTSAHGMMHARYTLNRHCLKRTTSAADYQRQWRRKRAPERAGAEGEARTAQGGYLASGPGSEFVHAKAWGRFWQEAREQAGPARGVHPVQRPVHRNQLGDRQEHRPAENPQRAGRGSPEVTSRYAAILDERDHSATDAFEAIFVEPARG